MHSSYLHQVEGVRGLACRVHYVRVILDKKSSQTTCAFFLKLLTKVYKLSLVFRVRLMDKSGSRRIEFGFKQERKVISRVNRSSVHASKTTRNIS